MINVFKGTLALTGKPVWIWLNAITSITVNQPGGAIIHTIDGLTYALKETPDQVFELITNALKATQAAA